MPGNVARVNLGRARGGACRDLCCALGLPTPACTCMHVEVNICEYSQTTTRAWMCVVVAMYGGCWRTAGLGCRNVWDVSCAFCVTYARTNPEGQVAPTGQRGSTRDRRATATANPPDFGAKSQHAPAHGTPPKPDMKTHPLNPPPHTLPPPHAIPAWAVPCVCGAADPAARSCGA